LQIDNTSVSKRSHVHKPAKKPKKLYLFDFLGEDEKEYQKEK